MSTMTTTTPEERAALANAMTARAAQVAAYGRRLADEPDAEAPAGLSPEELRAAHAEAARWRRLRPALLARRELAALDAREAEERARGEARRTELRTRMRELEVEMELVGRPAHEAAQAAAAARRSADGVFALLDADTRARIAALNQRIIESRGRAARLRAEADAAPGLVERAVARIAEATRALAGFRRGYDDVSWRDGNERTLREAEAERVKALAVSPSALRREADAMDATAADADAELRAAWAAVERAAGLVPTAPTDKPAAPSGRSKRAR